LLNAEANEIFWVGNGGKRHAVDLNDVNNLAFGKSATETNPVTNSISVILNCNYI
jgi:hypothetical protein